MRAKSILPALAVLLLSASSLAAADFHMSLFDGKSLDGWLVTGCDVGVENGAIVLKSGDGFVRSAHRYADFVLELDWKARKASGYDSGIYIRSELPAEGKPWPDRYQVNLFEGEEGNLLGLASANSKGLVKKGEWNHFKLIVKGNAAELQINGQPAWKAVGLDAKDGYIGLQAEVAGGGQFEFRNITVTESGYTPLFNGKDLTGWQGATTGYAAEKDVLVCRKDGGGNLFTDKQFADFSFRFEFKLEPGGNNGVGIRAPLSGDVAYSGMEIQILDDTADIYKNLKPFQYHGSVYGIVPAKRGHQNPLGQWNRQEIVCRGRQVTVNLNGVTIVDADIDKASTPQTIDGNAHPGLKNKTGFIGFLGHGARIEFRNLRVLDLGQ